MTSGRRERTVYAPGLVGPSHVRGPIVNETEVLRFVTRFAGAWAARDGEAFLALWHPEGTLHYPFAGRLIRGTELGRLQEVQRERAPDLVGRLLDWTWRDDVVVIEWQTTQGLDGEFFAWRGVDEIRLADGKIIEEWVYCDTALVRALRTGADRAALQAAARNGVGFEPLFDF